MVPAITARDEMIAPAPGTARTGPPVPATSAVIVPEDPGIAGKTVATPARASAAGGRSPRAHPAVRRAVRAPGTPAAATTGDATTVRVGTRARPGPPGRNGRRAGATATGVVRPRVVRTGRDATSRTATAPRTGAGPPVRIAAHGTIAAVTTVDATTVAAALQAVVGPVAARVATRVPPVAVPTGADRTTAAVPARVATGGRSASAARPGAPAASGRPRPRAAAVPRPGSHGRSGVTGRIVARASGRPTVAGTTAAPPDSAAPTADGPTATAGPPRAPTATGRRATNADRARTAGTTTVEGAPGRDRADARTHRARVVPTADAGPTTGIAVPTARPTGRATTATGRPARAMRGAATTAAPAAQDGQRAERATATGVVPAATTRTARPDRGTVDRLLRGPTPHVRISRSPTRPATATAAANPRAPTQGVRMRLDPTIRGRIRPAAVPGGPSRIDPGVRILRVRIPGDLIPDGPTPGAPVPEDPIRDVPMRVDQMRGGPRVEPVVTPTGVVRAPTATGVEVAQARSGACRIGAIRAVVATAPTVALPRV